MNINKLRQYRKNKGRRLLLQHELDNMMLSGMELDDPEIKWRKLEIYRLNCELREVRDYIEEVDPYIGTMLRLHYLNGKKWSFIAAKHGGNSGDSVRKMCHRYVQKH